MRRVISQMLLTLLLFSITTFSQTDNGWKMTFGGKARKAVKLRPSELELKSLHKESEAIRVKKASKSAFKYL